MFYGRILVCGRVFLIIFPYESFSQGVSGVVAAGGGSGWIVFSALLSRTFKNVFAALLIL